MDFHIVKMYKDKEVNKNVIFFLSICDVKVFLTFTFVVKLLQVVESDFKVPNLPLSLRLKGSGCHYSSIYYNIGTKQVK
jgi:hypothetical protein